MVAIAPTNVTTTETNMTGMPFAKMNGAGNQIIVADARGRKDRVSAEAAIILAGKNAIPFDQLMEISDPQNPGEDAAIRILNSDGTPAQACGNGTRCVAAFLREQTGLQSFRLRTVAGLLETAANDDGQFTVDMGIPRFQWDQIPLEEEFGDTTGIELQVGPIDEPVLHTPSVANMGNPHAVFWVENDIWSYELDLFGPMLEYHPVFPERANISIVKVNARDHLSIRTWERGAGLTLACGSAACAALVCAVRKDLADRKARVTTPGGDDLIIEWTDENRVLMTGPAKYEFSGVLDPDNGAFEIYEGNRSTAALDGSR